jgi:hypothetical protein
LRTMIGVHRSASNSDVRAIGQYWPYSATRQASRPDALGSTSDSEIVNPGQRRDLGRRPALAGSREEGR